MEVNKFKITSKFILALLAVAFVAASCTPRVPHLTQNLENSGVSQTPGSSAQTPAAETYQANSPSATNPSTSTAIEPLATQAPSSTFNPVLTGTSLPAVQNPITTSTRTLTRSGTAASTRTPTQTRTATSTPKFTQLYTATSTRTPTQTRTATATLTATLTATPTPTKTDAWTQTPTEQTGWAGDWQVFWQLDNNNYVEGTITVEVVGTDFTASGAVGGVDYTFTGRIIHEGETAFGNWTSPSGNGDFIWTNAGSGQFGGSRDLNYGLCGAREGAAPPNPCYIAPLS